MYTVNAIAKQANVSFDAVRNILKRRAIEPVQSYSNGAHEILLYSQEAMNTVIAEAATIHAKRAENKMKTLKKIAGVSIVQNNNEILAALAHLNSKLNNIEQTLQRIEASLPKFDMEAM